jgi:hypothetical protein
MLISDSIDLLTFTIFVLGVVFLVRYFKYTRRIMSTAADLATNVAKIATDIQTYVTANPPGGGTTTQLVTQDQLDAANAALVAADALLTPPPAQAGGLVSNAQAAPTGQGHLTDEQIKALGKS